MTRYCAIVELQAVTFGVYCQGVNLILTEKESGGRVAKPRGGVRTRLWSSCSKLFETRGSS